MDFSLLPFFKPQGVVVIGASTSPEKLGYGVARNLIQSGYKGPIHFVSQKQGELFGKPIYTILDDIPDPVELAILIVPTNATPQTIEDCGKRRIKAAVIVSAGFREVGEEGAKLEQQCLEIARKYNIRLLGPNCIGTIDTHFPLDTTFLQPPMPTKGGIGFISHSGAFAAAIVDWARSQGFGFSQIVSLGNQADVNETDMLPMLANDPNTKVIVMYMESVSDGRRFVEVACEVTKRKPVIALKVGRFKSGQKAAASHTGALAASDTAFDAAFKKAGILRAETTGQMFEWATALENCPLPKGKNIAILTNAGGPGVIAADVLEQNGLSLAKLNGSTLKALSQILPPSAAIHNPVDMLASASPDVYADCLKLLLADSNVDGVMVILPPPPMFKAEDVAKKIIHIFESDSKLSANGTKLPETKPVVVALPGSTLIQKARSMFEHSGIPTYLFPEQAASAMSVLVNRTEHLEKNKNLMTHSPGAMLETFGIPHVSDKNIDALLTSYGIPTLPLKLAHDEKEAVTMANELGYPVVLKIASPGILHKSDVGGVVLDIGDDKTLSSAYAQVLERVKSVKPEAKIDGIHIQRQVPDGQEVIVGMVRDPHFGPMMMFGSGGVEVEGLKDVTFSLAPLNQAEALKMIRETWAGRKLKGFRNTPAVDEEAVIDVLVKLSNLARDHEIIDEIEINPLRVLSKGTISIDVRIKTRGET